MKRTISLHDKRYFDLFIGKRVLMKQLFRTGGHIPIYSGNVHMPFGYVKESNIPDFEHAYIVWGIDDAAFDFGLFPKGIKFATTDHVGGIALLDEAILPEYLFYELRARKEELDFGWSIRPSMKVVKKINVDIPIKSDGSFDVDSQRDIAQKFILLEKVKTRLIQTSEYLTETNIAVSESEIGKYATVCLGDRSLFTVDNGERITRKDIEKAKGSIPVYSSSKFENDVLGYVSDKIRDVVKGAASFDGLNLTVNADGSVGSVFVRKGKFYANDICNVVSVSHPKIDLHYLKHELTTQIYFMALDYSFKLYKKKLRNLKVRLPIDENGEYDLGKQLKIAEQHNQLYHTKEKILEQLQVLGNATIAI